MSIAINVPNRTRILVKDLLFQEKYHLSHTQTDLMAYMVNVTYWAINVDSYFVIATGKVMTDLPQMGEKTFEASFKVLKDLGLIESKLIEVKEWKGKPKLRGIKLTKKGQEYNAKLYLPTQDKEKKALEKQVKELKETIEQLEIKIEKKDTKNEEIEEKEAKSEPIAEITLPKKDEVDNFIEKVTKHFGINGKPLCNFVPKHDKNTTFYINSYKKLAVIIPSGEYKQLSSPKDIYSFWQWLYLNSHRIGNKIDFKKTPTLKELEDRYNNRTIKLGENRCTIIGFVQENSCVKIKIRNTDGKCGFLVNSKNKSDALFELAYCQKVVLDILV